MTSDFPFPISLAVWAHVIGGTAALATFVIPILSRKGGKLHVRTGWVYAIGMLMVVVSAFIITPWRYFIDPERTQESQGFAFFLFFIALFALTALQQGIYIFRHKKRDGRVVSIGSLGLPVLLLFIAFLILVKGFGSQNWLFVIFALIAGRTAVMKIKYWLSQPAHPREWWFFHLESMFTCCIATITAFTVTAVPRLIPGIPIDSVWVWLTPTFVLVPWMLWFRFRYERQFGLKKI